MRSKSATGQVPREPSSEVEYIGEGAKDMDIDPEVRPHEEPQYDNEKRSGADKGEDDGKGDEAANKATADDRVGSATPRSVVTARDYIGPIEESTEGVGFSLPAAVDYDAKVIRDDDQELNDANLEAR